MMGFLKSAAGILTALLCAVLVAAAVWFWAENRAHAARPDGTLVLRDGETAEAFAVPADILIPVSAPGEVRL